jgi:alkylation response protein AidB-like acyl-CoA dehydrogenase
LPYDAHRFYYSYNLIVSEELEAADAGAVFFPLGSDIVLPYFLHAPEEARALWLPRIAAGAAIAVAMSEPEAGSDLLGTTTTATKVPGGWKISGRKMWISNGAIASYTVVVAYTGDRRRANGLSLFVVEKGMPGFKVVKTVSKIGRHSQDTALLSLEDVFVPDTHILGAPGSGFATLMRNLPQERLSIAVAALAGARRVLSHTINYVQKRELFDRTVGDFQWTAFNIAELCADINACQALCDRAVSLHCEATCSAQLASMIKWKATELYSHTADKCLQFFGGYGFLRHAPIAKHWTAARVTMIYGGANEVMREITAKQLGFKRAPPPKSKATAKL